MEHGWVEYVDILPPAQYGSFYAIGLSTLAQTILFQGAHVQLFDPTLSSPGFFAIYQHNSSGMQWSGSFPVAGKHLLDSSIRFFDMVAGTVKSLKAGSTFTLKKDNSCPNNVERLGMRERGIQ